MARAPSILHRRGTARVRFFGADQTITDRVDALVTGLRAGAGSHDLAPGELFVAEELARMSPWLSEASMQAVVIATLVTMIAERNGSTRVPLATEQTGYLGTLVRELLGETNVELTASTLVAELRRLASESYFGRIVGGPQEDRPLVIDSDCLYSQRFFATEKRLIELLAGRLRTGASSAHEQATAAAIGASSFELSAEQQQAVRSALALPLSAISGGPGTGKTAVTATIVDAALTANFAPSQIALAAPTGRAAQNLQTAISRRTQGSTEVPPPQTLHRLLGYRSHGGFRHNRQNPLSAKLIIVDEASMIGLALMERLLDSVVGGAHLVLLGDAEQLPSVEAGAVFRDVVAAAAAIEGTEPFTVHLGRSYRLDVADPGARQIAELAHELRGGLLHRLEDVPTAKPPRVPTSGIHNADDAATKAAEFAERWIAEHFSGEGYPELAAMKFPTRDGSLDTSVHSDFHRLERGARGSKMLTATRHDSMGSVAWAERLHGSLRRHFGRPGSTLGPGEPVIVTTNDYRLGLFNGDSGVAISTTEDGVEHLRIAFSTATGEIRLFPREALVGISELGLATTIHRAQGSEYEHVAVVFPDADVPLLCRELLYTAITRARKSVLLVGNLETFVGAARRSLQRFSGIAQGLVEVEV